MKKIVFFNPFHNGDVHLGRTFVKDLVQKLSADKYEYQHANPRKLLLDIQNLHHFPLVYFQKETKVNDSIIELNNMTLINTWIGQDNLKYVLSNGGSTFNAYYTMFKDIFEKLGMSDKFESKEYYLPSIDYSVYKIQNIDNFIEGKVRNVLVSNQDVKSLQTPNFSFDEILLELSDKYKDVNFFVTNRTHGLLKNRRDNIFFSQDIINIEESDLNENSYLSTKCSIIVGRSSGAYCFSQTKQNYFDETKTFVCFDALPAQALWVRPQDVTINAKIVANSYIDNKQVFAVLDEVVSQKFL